MCWADFEEFLTNKMNVWKNADWRLQGWKISIYLYSIHTLHPSTNTDQEAEKNHFGDVGAVKIQFWVRVPLQCEQLPPRHERDKVWDQLTSCQLQDHNRVSRLCQLQLKFNQHWKCILSPTYTISPLYFFGWLSSHDPLQAESNSRSNLKMQISLLPSCS